ncbi:MAG: geranylgeranyl diphosphate reductase [Sedimenticolaceae bacterium]
MSNIEQFDAVVVGGGPAGATAATDLARQGHRVLLLERGGRIKPCGGAIPPRLIEEFAIPHHLLVARINSARMISPADKRVDMPINGGFVGMVDRDVFDPWLRDRARAAGAEVRTGTFEGMQRTDDGKVTVTYRQVDAQGEAHISKARTTAVIGADGAKSMVARQSVPDADKIPCVAAYHEIVESPPEGGNADFDGRRCDVWYQGRLSPDFYAWVFPHGDKTSIGVGTAQRGYSLRGAVRELRESIGLEGSTTVRCEGAPIPLRPLKRWDDGRNVVLAGDAAGVVAPASGEGIYYAMAGGRFAAEAVMEFLSTANPVALRKARKRFMRSHGKVFWVLGMMQRFWYANDKRRERFVSICRDPDVQFLTWEAYMHKRLVKARPAAHMRIFFKDLAHLFGVVRP